MCYGGTLLKKCWLGGCSGVRRNQWEGEGAPWREISATIRKIDQTSENKGKSRKMAHFVIKFSKQKNLSALMKIVRKNIDKDIDIGLKWWQYEDLQDKRDEKLNWSWQKNSNLSVVCLPPPGKFSSYNTGGCSRLSLLYHICVVPRK